MSFFQKVLDRCFGVERATISCSSEATKHIEVRENGKMLTAAEFYDDVVVKNEKEMLNEREAFLTRVGDRMAS